jgi:ubiquitin carboxyl-terminal hydrolase 14
VKDASIVPVYYHLRLLLVWNHSPFPHRTLFQQEFYSGLLTILSGEMHGSKHIEAGLGSTTSSDQLMGANNLVDAVFGLKMEETLTCEEVADDTAEPPVKSFDLHRKLVCNIQGGESATNDANVTHISQGIQLSLNGQIEKHSNVLGRNALWKRQQRIARLSPILTVQFGRFYWKLTPDSQDHAGVKCKVMKPVAFTSTLDVYEFCSESVQAVLKVARDKALAAEEDAINKKLLGQQASEDDGKDADATDADNKMDTSQHGASMEVDDDPDLQAALAMSMEAEQLPVGPGLPANFQGIYELFAVVTHKGRDADGGHYMAWVKADQNVGQVVQKIADTDVENEDWFVFDDDEVSPCKTEDVLKLKGGGDWHMSYMNFYRAKK